MNRPRHKSKKLDPQKEEPNILPPKPEESNRTARPLVIGEVLFDTFPDGRKVLGGAPFNVAWNLRGFEQNPLFVSAVGRDASAEEIRQQMNQHKMDDSGLQSNSYPTGKVDVTFQNGEPSYEIAPDQAWDYLSVEDDLRKESSADDEFAIIYHGSLIWRSPNSRAAVETLRKKNNAFVFVDLNIRLPWFEPDQVEEILTDVDAVKLNIDELASLAGQPISEKNSIASAAALLLNQHALRSLWVTAGADGAYYFDAAGQTHFAAAPELKNLVDTVGAGDAFASVVIKGLLLNQAPEVILSEAVKHAAKVCGLQGATTNDRDFYRSI